MNGACVTLLPAIKVVLVVFSSLKDSSSRVKWIDHKAAAFSLAPSRVNALSMTFLRSAEDGWAQAPVRALWKSGAAPCQTLVHLEAISWGGLMPAHPVRCPQIKQMALTAAAEATSVEEPCMHARQTLFVRDRAS